MEAKYSIQKKIYQSALNHFKNEIHTLNAAEKLNQNTLGLEGWFRVELINAVEGKNLIEKICNKGADLKLSNNDYLVLKAATDFNFTYIINGIKNYPCLFLGKPRGKRENFTKEMLEFEFKKRTNAVVEMKRLQNNWYIGLIYNL